MESPKLCSCRIAVHAKSKGLDLRLWASNLLPQRGNGGERISLLLRLRRFFFLKVELANGSPVRRGATRSRLFRFSGRFFWRQWWWIRNRFDPKRRSDRRTPRAGFSDYSNAAYSFSKVPITSMLGSLSLLSNSASEKDYTGIIIHAFSLFFYVFLIFKIKKSQVHLFLVAKEVSLIGVSLSFFSLTGVVSKAVWEAWNSIISFGCLTVLSQVILPKFSLCIERHLMTWLLFSAFVSFLVHKLSIALLIKCSNIAIKGSMAWIPNLLLACQAFFHILGRSRGLEALRVYLFSAYFWGKKFIGYTASYTMT